MPHCHIWATWFHLCPVTEINIFRTPFLAALFSGNLPASGRDLLWARKALILLALVQHRRECKVNYTAVQVLLETT